MIGVSMFLTLCAIILSSYSVKGCGCPNGFTLLDFENIPNVNPSTDLNAVPSNYSGFVWTNINVVMPSVVYPNSGFMTLARSGNGTFVAYNALARVTSIGTKSLQLFNVKSFLATGVWNNNLKLSILGYRSGHIVHTFNAILQATTTSIINLDWANIDRMNFTSSGGNNAGFPQYSGYYFAMDDLCVSTKSEETIIG